MTDTADLLRTALTGRYEIERELGAGGMAVSRQPTAISRQRSPNLVRLTESNV